MLREDDPADFIVVSDLQKFEVLQTFIDGQLVAERGHSKIGAFEKVQETINRFEALPKEKDDFALLVETGRHASFPVIEALDGQLITNRVERLLPINNGPVECDLSNDILKIVVVNRYFDAPVAKAFVKNFSFVKGAIASSVAHDSHNIVAVGVNDEAICEAVNLIIASKGGVCCVVPNATGTGYTHELLPLPVAGLMSDANGYEVAARYTALDTMAKSMGSTLSAPFMTLSFMALLVIPHLKLSDKGLFDGDTFTFVQGAS